LPLTRLGALCFLLMTDRTIRRQMKDADLAAGLCAYALQLARAKKADIDFIKVIARDLHTLIGDTTPNTDIGTGRARCPRQLSCWL
jgi:hypothetical protein